MPEQTGDSYAPAIVTRDETGLKLGRDAPRLSLAFVLSAGSETARAAPGFDRRRCRPRLPVTQARIYRRGRTPIYPYYYNPGRPGGYSFYFGFVPYAQGNIENQAIQRSQYPQNIEWPPSVRWAAPGLGTEAAD